MWKYRYTEDCLLKGKCLRKCNPSCTIQPELYYLLENSNIPEMYKKPKLLYPAPEDFNAFTTLNEVKKDVEVFTEEGRFLYIWGKSSGNGKSGWACKILQTYLAIKCIGNGFKDRGWFEYIPSFLLIAKNFEDKETRQEHIDNLLKRDLVILDDIGAVRNTQYDITVLSDIINTRYSSNLATIFTSNVEPSNLAIDERLINRMESDMVIEIKGKSHRESTSTYRRKSEAGEPVVRSRVSNHF
jgi:DNA replication protein DnaC